MKGKRMKKIALMLLSSLVLFGCQTESMLESNITDQDSTAIHNGTNSLINKGVPISFKITPEAGDTLSLCDTITIKFSAEVIPTQDDYGNTSFTRYNGPAHVLVNAHYFSATYVIATNVYDDETNTLKIAFPSTEVHAASNEVMNIAVELLPQYMHGVNGEKIAIPSVDNNGGYAVIYKYQEKTSCATDN